MKAARIVFLLQLAATIASCLAEPPNKSVAATTPPHLKRVGRNLCEDSALRGNGFWSLGPSTEWDARTSRSPGSKSVKFAGDKAALVSQLIALKPGRNYTLAVYMKSSGWPSPLIGMQVGVYNGNKKFITNAGGGRHSPSQSNVWEECVYFLRFPPEAAFAQIKLALNERPAEAHGGVWVDDVYFGEGEGFEQPPSPKRPFDGSHVRADALGNVDVLRNGKWTPFFPMGICADMKREDWSIYSRQGFNMEMRSGAASLIEHAKNAKSEFNPDGMMSGFDFTAFVSPSNSLCGNLSLLETRLRDVFDRHLDSHLLCYYWDNECHEAWALPHTVTDKVKRLDLDAQGRRSHPIFALQGNYGIARTFAAEGVTDMVGTYVSDEARRLLLLDRIEGQRNPVVFAQINLGVGRLFRPTLYTAIIKGAKGMSFWRDCYRSKTGEQVEDQPWWPDLPNLRREIDQMLPLIRQPHWTNWRVVTETNTPLHIGTRDFMGEGYILLANWTDKPVPVKFRAEGLSYPPIALLDYFNGRRLSAGPFLQVTVPAYGSAVCRLQRR